MVEMRRCCSIDLKDAIQCSRLYFNGAATVLTDLNRQVNIPGQKRVVSKTCDCVDLRAAQTRNTLNTVWVCLRTKLRGFLSCKHKFSRERAFRERRKQPEDFRSVLGS